MRRRNGKRLIDRYLFGRRIIVGYNAEKTLRFGKKQEKGFMAYGIWPLLIGIGKPSDRRLGRSKVT